MTHGRPAAVHARPGPRPIRQDAGRSVPRNLDLPDDDPNNYWGRFVYETVRYYAGRIDEWIIWNEPEFTARRRRRQRLDHLARHRRAVRAVDAGRLPGRQARQSDAPSSRSPAPRTGSTTTAAAPSSTSASWPLGVSNPDAARQSGFYHDAVPLNLYRAPDDLVRLHAEFKDIQKRYGVGRPMWLLELNAMPTDDLSIPCADVHARNPIQTTQAAAGGVRHPGLRAGRRGRLPAHRLLSDGRRQSVRPVGGVGHHPRRRHRATGRHDAAHRGADLLGLYARPVRTTGARRRRAGRPGRSIRRRYTPNWQIYQVVFDLPSRQRVTVLWNGDGTAVRARLQ